MPATVHRFEPAAERRDAQPGREPGAKRDRPELDVLTLVILLVGLGPFAGLAIAGRWSQAELGAGAVMAILAGRELVRHFAGRWRRRGDPGVR